jgi:hypothetical protein
MNRWLYALIFACVATIFYSLLKKYLGIDIQLIILFFVLVIYARQID